MMNGWDPAMTYVVNTYSTKVDEPVDDWKGVKSFLTDGKTDTRKEI